MAMAPDIAPLARMTASALSNGRYERAYHQTLAHEDKCRETRDFLQKI
jgi:hypothetical protein